MPHVVHVDSPPQVSAPALRSVRRKAHQVGPAAADEVKRAFLRMASHELRTPLNAIIGFSEVISSELYGPLGQPQYREYAEIIRQSGHQLLTLVNQVLEMARLEGGAAELHPEVEPLGPALREAVAERSHDLRARKAQVILPEGELPDVLVDGRGLSTMLGALLENAVQNSPEGGVVTVRVRCAERRVTVEVEDQGPGCDARDLPRMLRPFEQGEGALARKAAGAGLGLPIARLLAEASGGALRLSSHPGGGLTAHLTLPRA